nr:MAG TPA: hypothetical protein [Caudoviricetes sp.]
MNCFAFAVLLLATQCLSLSFLSFAVALHCLVLPFIAIATHIVSTLRFAFAYQSYALHP